MSQPALPPGSDSNPSLVPPDLVRELHVASYVFAGSLAVLIWDILHNITDDYSILFKYKFQLSAVAYVVSRISCLIYVLGFTLFAIFLHPAYPLSDCNAAMLAFNGFYPILSGSTSLLFFFRVRAIYNHQRLITWFFGLLLLCALGASMTIPIGTSVAQVGTSCIITYLAPYIGANGIAMTVFDTSVFLAISCRLLANSHVEQTRGEKVRALFRGANLHAFSKALFRDGQKYYLITVFTNAITITMVYSPNLNPIYRGMMAIPNTALINIMVCRVYRNVKLHYMHFPRMSLPPISASGSGTGHVTVDLDTFSPSPGTRETSSRRAAEDSARGDGTQPDDSESAKSHSDFVQGRRREEGANLLNTTL
ncbi:hypothetical protein B0H19DRAFT_1161548 [Mycena capillaripes]|nr:hypothetical protein B0H19DRAFT_1161548 [Mycena capillaripes]